MPTAPYAFISYSSKEYPYALQVNQVLTENRIRCWMAPQSIPGGSDYTRSIPEAISKCSVFVLVCSKNSQESYWVKSEVLDAITKGRTIIPFIIDDYPMTEEFNFMLSPQHRINAFHNKEASFKSLVTAIKNIMPDESAQGEFTGEQPQIPSDTGQAPAPTPPEAVQTTQTTDEPKKSKFRRRVLTKPISAPEAEGKAVIVRSPISFVPNLISWLIWGALSVYSLGFMFSNPTADECDTIFGCLIYVFAMHAVTFVCMIIVKKDKTAEPTSINKTRWILVGNELMLYFLIALTFFVTGFAFYDSYSFTPTVGIYSLFLTIAFIALTVVCTVRFKRGISFLWFRNREATVSEYSSLPSFIMIVLAFISLYLAYAGSLTAERSSCVSFYFIGFIPQIIMLAVCLILLVIARRHKTAPAKSIKRARIIITALYILYALYSFIYIHALPSDSFFRSSSSLYTGEKLMLIIPGIVLTLAAAIYILVFRRLKYAYETSAQAEKDKVSEE